MDFFCLYFKIAFNFWGVMDVVFFMVRLGEFLGVLDDFKVLFLCVVIY